MLKFLAARSDEVAKNINTDVWPALPKQIALCECIVYEASDDLEAGLASPVSPMDDRLTCTLFRASSSLISVQWEPLPPPHGLVQQARTTWARPADAESIESSEPKIELFCVLMIQLVMPMPALDQMERFHIIGSRVMWSENVIS